MVARRMRVRARSSRSPQSWPSMTMRPPVGCSSRPAACRRDDFPEPEGPTSPTISPAETVRSAPLSTSSGPCPVAYTGRRPSTASTGSLIAKRLNWIEARGPPGRQQGEQEGGGQGPDRDPGHLEPIDLGRHVGEEIDVGVEDLDTRHPFDEALDGLDVQAEHQTED